MEDEQQSDTKKYDRDEKEKKLEKNNKNSNKRMCINEQHFE